MHEYEIENKKRRTVTAILVVIYILLSIPLSEVSSMITSALTQWLERSQVSVSWVNAVLSAVLPGVGVGGLYWLYDNCLWKCKFFLWLHKIPDLNGEWVATVESPLKGSNKSTINMKIRQTWTTLSVTGESTSRNKTRTVSNTASILKDESGICLSYSYHIYQPVNAQYGNQTYLGFNSLKYENGKLDGDYFTMKDVAYYIKDGFTDGISEEQWNKLRDGLKGCGSKGHITLQRKKSASIQNA